MIANARVEAHPFNNLASIQSKAFCVAVELIKISHSHRQIGIREELDRLSFSGVGK